MIAPKISAHARRKWVTKNKKMVKQDKKKEKVCKKGQEIVQLAKKTVNKIFWFSAEFGASAWEGIRRSRWEFSIVILEIVYQIDT